MDIVEHIISRATFLQKIENVAEQLQLLSKVIIDQLKPESGPYLLLHHIVFTLQHVQELSVIIRRLYDNRELLLKEDLLWQLSQRSSGFQSGILSAECQEVFKRQRDLDAQIVLDFQTMLLFASIALDDWAHIAGYILNVPNPSKSDFLKVAKHEENNLYKPLWNDHKLSILWLDAFVRLYRNKMVVHKEEPWQISHTRSMSKLDWSFATPVAFGWLSENAMNQAHKELIELADKVGLQATENIYQLVFSLLEGCHLFSVTDRKKVYKLAETIGFSTPSFQAFAHKLADFMYSGTVQLIQEARNNPSNINLGRPPR